MTHRTLARSPPAAAVALTLLVPAIALGPSISTGSAPSDADDETEHVCKQCTSMGREPCEEHDEHEYPLEDAILCRWVVADYGWNPVRKVWKAGRLVHERR